MSIDRHLVDTNVLVYALYSAAPQHVDSRALLDSANDPAAALCVFPHLFAEFYSIVTNPKRVTAAKSAEEALQAIEKYLALPGLVLLPLPADVVTRWITLVRARPVTGAEVFDVQTVAAMQFHGLTQVYTYNLADFQGYPGIHAEHPPPIVGSTSPPGP